MIKRILIPIFTILNMALNASDCYHYHTKTYHEIKTEKGKAIWVRTVKDWNDVSIVSVEKTPIENINSNEVTKLAEDENGFLISDDTYYYWLERNSFFAKRTGACKIIAKEKVSETFGTKAFCIDGKWKYIDYNVYSNTSETKDLKGFPNNPTILQHKEIKSYLLKDDKNVFAYNEREGTITVLKDLDASTTHFVWPDLDSKYGDSFIYDNNTFYLIDINYEIQRDITADFPQDTDFSKMEITVNQWGVFMELDNMIWAYVKSGISLTDGRTIYFYPIEDAKWLNDQKEFVVHDNNLYRSAWELVYKRNYIDLSEVSRSESLRKKEWGYYTDGVHNYILKYLAKEQRSAYITQKFVKINANIPDTIQLFNTGHFSYQHRQDGVLSDGNTIFHLTDEFEVKEMYTHQSAIKKLKLAYAFDDKLLIENKLIPSIADRETLEFVGSTVDVISPCDGGRGQYDVVVEYNYYFKDKNRVYKYHTGENALQILDLPPTEISEENFIDRMVLKQQ